MHYVNCKWDRNVCTLRQLQGDDDGLHDDEDSELEYDALNDETFGGAIKGNWEDLHENLVQLDRTRDIDDGDEHPVDLTGLTSNKHSGEGNRNDFFSLGESLLSYFPEPSTNSCALSFSPSTLRCRTRPLADGPPEHAQRQL